MGKHDWKPSRKVDLDLPILKKGSFYTIKETRTEYILEDRTKRGLKVRETAIDQKLGVKADQGMIHDMDGIGHTVSIRWYFAKSEYELDQVIAPAEELEKRYTLLRELTCPDDSD